MRGENHERIINCTWPYDTHPTTYYHISNLHQSLNHCLQFGICEAFWQFANEFLHFLKKIANCSTQKLHR